MKKFENQSLLIAIMRVAILAIALKCFPENQTLLMYMCGIGGIVIVVHRFINAKENFKYLYNELPQYYEGQEAKNTQLLINLQTMANYYFEVSHGKHQRSWWLATIDTWLNLSLIVMFAIREFPVGTSHDYYQTIAFVVSCILALLIPLYDNVDSCTPYTFECSPVDNDKLRQLMKVELIKQLEEKKVPVDIKIYHLRRSHEKPLNKHVLLGTYLKMMECELRDRLQRCEKHLEKEKEYIEKKRSYANS